MRGVSIMVTGDTVFHGGIADVYDRLLVPMLFEAYAIELAGRVATLGARDVLETAAGTGVLTRQLAARLGEQARIVATDLNAPMVNLGRANNPDPRIQWQVADALELPFGREAFDVVACQFGVMFFPDKLRAYREVLRVLRPGGHFLFSAWGKVAENEFAEIVTAALAALFPDDPPDFMVRIPHGYHDSDRILADLAAAGLQGMVIEAVPAMGHAACARDIAVAYCQGTPMRNEIEKRAASGLDEVTKAAERALVNRLGAGPIAGRLQALVVQCRAPGG